MGGKKWPTCKRNEAQMLELQKQLQNKSLTQDGKWVNVLVLFCLFFMYVNSCFHLYDVFVCCSKTSTKMCQEKLRMNHYQSRIRHLQDHPKFARGIIRAKTNKISHMVVLAERG